MANHSRSLQNDTIIDGTYKVLDFLGEGGMGLVYKVEHIQMNRVFALKILKTSQLSESAWQRFRNEAQAIARLDHRNVVKIYDMNQTENGRPYYTMDFLVGISLSDYLKKNKVLTLAEALHVFRQVCSGLAYAHSRGIVHRDIKPANLMLLTDPKTQEFQVKIVDFGIAKLADDEGHTIQGLTKPGEVFGSPLYMSPEQCEGRRLDARSDMYSMAVSLFKALTGTTPFRGRTAIETTMMHQSSVPPLLNSVSPDLQFPSKLEKLVDKMLAKAPDQRYQSLAEVEGELQKLQARSKPAPQTAAPYDHGEDDQDDDELDATTASGTLTVANKKLNKRLTVIVIVAFVAITASIGTLFSVATLAGKKKPVVQAAKPIVKVETHEGDFIDSASLGNYEGDLIQKNDVSTAPIDEQIQQSHDAAEKFVKTNKRLYSTKKQLANGVSQTVFQFPSEFSLGTLVYSPAKEGQERAVARGMQIVPIGADVRLEADEIVGEQPKLLSFFQPDDIKQLKIPRSVTGSAQLYQEIASLNKLVVLEAADQNLTEANLKQIEKLNHLISLNVSRSNVDGFALARSTVVPRLAELHMHGLKNVSAVISVLGGNIQNLVLNKCTLTAADLARVNKLPNLRLLFLTGCEINDGDLAKLAYMKSLQFLDISGCVNLTKDCFTTVKTLPKLKKVILPEQLNTPELQADLKKQYPELGF